uniref:Uncharacterized protein n=1 Tax=Oryza sativa subsp. japonica TaxID=39947 RepID=Q6ES91_ORYSJ|nr:hypothetical protein [Oryza sativa Japonica Group]
MGDGVAWRGVAILANRRRRRNAESRERKRWKMERRCVPCPTIDVGLTCEVQMLGLVGPWRFADFGLKASEGVPEFWIKGCLYGGFIVAYWAPPLLVFLFRLRQHPPPNHMAKISLRPLPSSVPVARHAPVVGDHCWAATYLPLKLGNFPSPHPSPLLPLASTLNPSSSRLSKLEGKLRIHIGRSRICKIFNFDRRKKKTEGRMHVSTYITASITTSYTNSGRLKLRE